MEIDNYFVREDRVIAIYHNPDSIAGGCWEIHEFYYDYILDLFKEIGYDDGEYIVSDMLFGDAFHCPTYLIDKYPISIIDNEFDVCDDNENGKYIQQEYLELCNAEDGEHPIDVWRWLVDAACK